MDQPQHYGWARAPFVPLTCSLLAGIVGASFFANGYAVSYPILAILAIAYSALLFAYYRSVRQQWLQRLLWLIGLAGLCVLGYRRLLQQQPKQQPAHFAHVLGGMTAYKGVVIDVNKKHHQAIVQVQSVCVNGHWQARQGKVKLNIWGQSLPSLAYGSLVHIQGMPQRLKGAVNPQATNYHQRWYRQGVFHAHRPSELVVYGVAIPSWIRYYGLRLRDYLRSKLAYYLSHEDTKGVVLSLLLGDRTHLTTAMRQQYVVTGLMHVLAVSGLHIGLLYLLLLKLLYGLGLCVGRPYQYRWTSVLCLWGYAFLTGLAPPVLRAVGMLSLFVLARWLQRVFNPINAVAVLVFLFCWYDPYMVFDVGFQLSFAAFLSIRAFYHDIAGLYHPEHRYKRYWWQMMAVSLAVQLGTLPISLYYFHFLSCYALLTNGLVLPLMPVLLTMGLGMLLLAWCAPIVGVLGWFLDTMLSFVHALLGYISRLPWAHVGPCYPSMKTIGCYYVVLLMLYGFFKRRRFAYMVLATCVCCLWGGMMFHASRSQKQQKAMIVYDVAPHSVVALIDGQKQAHLISDKTMHRSTGHYIYQIAPSLDYVGVKDRQQYSFAPRPDANPFWEAQDGLSYGCWQGKWLVMVTTNKPLATKIASRRIDVLVLAKEGTLTPWLDYDIGIVVIGSAHTKGQALAAQAEAHGIRYHHVPTHGAYMLYW